MRVVIRNKVTNVGTHRGGVIAIDRKLPAKYRKPIVFHERREHFLMRKAKPKRSYRVAHRIANEEEREKYFKGNNEGWKEYGKVVRRIEKQNRRG
jgi:hypothetical protein